MIFRLLKEGIKIFVDAVKILKNENGSPAEKGEAILKLVAISLSTVIGIWTEGLINQTGIPEPWSIMLASMISATAMSGILYLLNRFDIFNVQKDLRRQRILEILTQMNQEVEEETDQILQSILNQPGCWHNI